ncbi:unnamed protein product [Penicillium olsonii]|nr:unnamed protein product [Penicillium olsonii]
MQALVRAVISCNVVHHRYKNIFPFTFLFPLLTRTSPLPFAVLLLQLFFSSMTSSRHRSSTIQPNGYATRFAGLMSPQQEQNPQEAASSRHKHQPPLQELPSYSSQLKSALAQKASLQDSKMNTRVR